MCQILCPSYWDVGACFTSRLRMAIFAITRAAAFATSMRTGMLHLDLLVISVLDWHTSTKLLGTVSLALPAPATFEGASPVFACKFVSSKNVNAFPNGRGRRLMRLQRRFTVLASQNSIILFYIYYN